MNPVSIPVDPAPPVGLAAYGVASLYTVKVFTRESYEAAFGVQPPMCDPARREKTWFDSSLTGDPEDQVTYQTITQGKDGYPVYRTIAMSVAEALKVNLSGVPHYPAYFVQPTKAVTVEPAATIAIPANYLSTKDQALLMCRELGVPTTSMNTGELVGPVHYGWPDDELRRIWTVGEKNENVGELLKMKYANGVGAPGVWTVTDGAHRWVAMKDPAVPLMSVPACPIPVRALLPAEKLGITAFGNIPQITNSEAPHPVEPVGGGGFTEADRYLLGEIAKRLGV
jgi:hypothetical protein